LKGKEKMHRARKKRSKSRGRTIFNAEENAVPKLSTALNIVEDLRSMSFSSLPRTLLLLSLGVALGTSVSYFLTIRSSRKIKRENDEILIMEDIVDGVEGLIGNTKLVRIRSLSIATGCEILAKAEVKTLFSYTSNWVVP
jgi:hypothetical protein